MANRLAGATSPYLAQHQDNPVDWWPWCAEAFAEAVRRDVPVLVSIGYAACHWCHVMAHESFENPTVAQVMNEHFVNVKVDREERPDVDAVYMNATQTLTGHGGWPMTVFLTPAGVPFYAGTYFPPAPQGQLPGFVQVLTAVAQTWQQRRGEVEQAGARIAELLARPVLPLAPGPGDVPAPPDADLAARAVQALTATEDRRYGGFGGAPKFPPSMALEFLLRHAARCRLAGQGDDGALDVAVRTLRAMAYSGMADQLGGGFARYAVDAAWVVPHFEKMVSDNALLARVYLHWYRLDGDPLAARIARQTCAAMLRELRTAHGGLASSLDADTPVRGADGRPHGVEGYTYVWTPGQLRDVLGEADAAWAAQLYRVTERGTFEHGASTLQFDPEVAAQRPDAERDALRDKLFQARQHRPQPARDDKVIAAWNGLAIAALAEVGAVLGEPEFLDAATAAADHLLAVHLVADGDTVRLRRASRDGVAGDPAGVLEDYADVAEGLLALHAASGEPAWLEVAGRLLDTVLDQFADGAGGFFDTPADAADPMLAAALTTAQRPKDPLDNAYPSGHSAAAGALLSYAALTGSARHREAAERALAMVAPSAAMAPRAFGWALSVIEALLDGPREVAVAGPQGAQRDALAATALAGTAPGMVLSVGESDADGLPLLAGRPTVAERPAAYVCRHFTCQAPVTEPAALAEQVGARDAGVA